MRDKAKTKGQLISELEMCRRRISELESLETELDNEHRWPEKALHETEKRYQALLETNLYAIQEIDIYGIITFMNSVFYRILGYKMGELKGRQIWDLLANDVERDRLTDYLTRIAEGEYASFPWVGEYFRKDGSILRLQVDWNYRPDAQGRVTGFISVISSVLERQPAQGEREAEGDDAVLPEAVEAATLAPPPPDREVGDLAEKMEALGRQMEKLYADFQTKLKYDAQKSNVIDRLHGALLDERRKGAGAGAKEAAPTPAPTPAPVSGESLEIGLARIETQMGQLRAEFEGKLKYDAHKNAIIDKLHQDLQEYKSDFLKKYLQSIIMDIIQIIDNIRKLVDHYEQQEAPDIDPLKILDILKGIPSDLEDLFFRQGVKPYTCDGEGFDPSRQRVLKTLTTRDQEKDKTVAESLRPGYEWEGQVIRPEMVAAYVYKDQSQG
jgi:PAS domain S-box-containing protein